MHHIYIFYTIYHCNRSKSICWSSFSSLFWSLFWPPVLSSFLSPFLVLVFIIGLVLVSSSVWSSFSSSFRKFIMDDKHSCCRWVMFIIVWYQHSWRQQFDSLHNALSRCFLPISVSYTMNQNSLSSIIFYRLYIINIKYFQNKIRCH